MFFPTFLPVTTLSFNWIVVVFVGALMLSDIVGSLWKENLQRVHEGDARLTSPSEEKGREGLLIEGHCTNVVRSTQPVKRAVWGWDYAQCCTEQGRRKQALFSVLEQAEAAIRQQCDRPKQDTICTVRPRRGMQCIGAGGVTTPPWRRSRYTTKPRPSSRSGRDSRTSSRGRVCSVQGVQASSHSDQLIGSTAFSITSRSKPTW